MRIPSSLNNSFAHGVSAFLTFALLVFVDGKVAAGVGCIVCVYAGWFRASLLSSFLGGVILAIAAWATVGVLFGPLGTASSALVMVPIVFVLAVPVAFGAFMLGKCVFIISHLKS